MSQIHHANRAPMFYSNCDDQLMAASLIFRSIAAMSLPPLHARGENLWSQSRPQGILPSSLKPPSD